MDANLIYNPKLDPIPNDLSLFRKTYGLKALGLTKIINYSPSFILISSNLFEDFLNNDKSFGKKVSLIFNELISIFGKDKKIILRSSGLEENVNQRGLYSSEVLTENWSKSKIEKAIKNLYIHFQKNRYSKNSTLGLIFQIYVIPKAKGHLSNERRVSRNNDLWVYEVEESSINNQKRIDRLRSKKNVTKSILSMDVSSSQSIESILRNFSGLFIHENTRYHLEWVLAGSRIYIVQIDVEQKNNGITPGSRWKYNAKSFFFNTFEILQTFSDIDRKWNKLKSVETFKKCDLPYGNIYIFQDFEVFNKIISGIFPKDLEKDLEKLLVDPVVIRTDCLDLENTFLLPRTATLTEVNQCKAFFSETLINFKEKGVNNENICFLIHHYISSKACALTLARPDIPKVKIDSTWGLPDGLHCFPYDTFEVNLFTGEVKKTLNSKQEYLDCDANGDWITVKSGWQWDWKSSLTDDQLDKIANFSYLVAKELGKPVGIMFFVDVDELTGYPNVLPWYYTLEIPASTFDATEIIFPKKSYIISTPKDLENLKAVTLSKDLIVKLILHPNHIRNNKFIVDIGKYLFENNIPLILEGSILSHVFYILKREKVNLKCSDPFSFDYQKQSFNKLVRDLIPEKILSGGEVPIVQSLDKTQLIDKLKRKAIEEAYELFREIDYENILEEMADIYEVLLSLSTLMGKEFDEIINIAQKKRTLKGGFEKGMYLISTTDRPLINKENHFSEIITNQNFKVDFINLNKTFSNKRAEFRVPLIPPKGNKINTKLKIGKQIDLDFKIEYLKNELKISVNKVSLTNMNPDQLEIEF